jgi:hypothetical protein
MVLREQNEKINILSYVREEWNRGETGKTCIINFII